MDISPKFVFDAAVGVFGSVTGIAIGNFLLAGVYALLSDRKLPQWTDFGHLPTVLIAGLVVSIVLVPMIRLTCKPVPDRFVFNWLILWMFVGGILGVVLLCAGAVMFFAWRMTFRQNQVARESKAGHGCFRQ